MKKEFLMKMSYFAFCGLYIIGAYLKICNWDEGPVIMRIGIVPLLCFIILAISEVSGSETISKNEKTMWISGFILLSPIAGFIYLFSARKRILKTKKL